MATNTASVAVSRDTTTAPRTVPPSKNGRVNVSRANREKMQIHSALDRE
jgi:hypothetical protein